MYELTAKMLQTVTFSAKGQPIVSFEFNEKLDALHMIDDLQQAEKLSVKVDKYREKRSLNANNYAWKLLTEIANMTRSSKEKMYLEMLKRYGQSEIISVLAHIPIGKYVKYYEEAGETTLNGKLFKHYKIKKVPA
jgi:hypothetical protein